MHGFPQGARLDIGFVKNLSQLLIVHAELVGVNGDGVQPVVGLHVILGSYMQLDAVNVGKGLLIHVLGVYMVGKVVIYDCHLSTAYACADVAHAVVVANVLVLIVREGLAGLGGEEEDALGGFLIGADKGATATGGNHLVAVERHHAIVAEGANHLTTIA